MVDPTKTIELKLPDTFRSLVASVHRQHNITIDTISQRLITLDPGETTGHSNYDGQGTIQVTQWPTQSVPEAYDRLVEDIQAFKPDHLRYEDYRIYSWKSQDHSWSPVHTIRWIGAIQVASHTTGVPSSCVMASAAKGWWTDAKLDHFGLNPKGLKHGRDALRHLLYFLLFPTKA